MSAVPSAARRSLALVLLLGATGAALVLLAVGRTWAKGRVSVQGGPHAALALTGREITAVPGALALAGIAALAAVFAVRRGGRPAVAVLLALSGAGAAAACALGAADDRALDEAASAATGLSGAAATSVTHTAWPWVAASGGLLLLLAGVVALARGRDWPGMSSRYEAPGEQGRPPGDPATAGRPHEMWQALDRGEDPTDR